MRLFLEMKINNRVKFEKKCFINLKLLADFTCDIFSISMSNDKKENTMQSV